MCVMTISFSFHVFAFGPVLDVNCELFFFTLTEGHNKEIRDLLQKWPH